MEQQAVQELSETTSVARVLDGVQEQTDAPDAGIISTTSTSGAKVSSASVMDIPSTITMSDIGSPPRPDTRTGNVSYDDNEVVHIYSVWTAENTENKAAVPFITILEVLNDNTGEVVRVKGLVNDGAMVNVMNSALWDIVQRRLQPVKLSSRKLRMANGAPILSEGCWTGNIRFGRARASCFF